MAHDDAVDRQVEELFSRHFQSDTTLSDIRALDAILSHDPIVLRGLKSALLSGRGRVCPGSGHGRDGELSLAGSSTAAGVLDTAGSPTDGDSGDKTTVVEDATEVGAVVLASPAEFSPDAVNRAGASAAPPSAEVPASLSPAAGIEPNNMSAPRVPVAQTGSPSSFTLFATCRERTTCGEIAEALARRR